MTTGLTVAETITPPEDPARPRRRRWLWLTIVAAIAMLVVVAVILVGRIGPWANWGFTEYRMLSRTDIPAAVAVARDGTVWFTIEFSDAIGLMQHGELKRIRKGSQNIEPLGLAVDADSFAWFTDGPKGVISRISPQGKMQSFSLSMPVVKFGRLAIAPDGALWFTEPVPVSVTQFKDGKFTRFAVGPPAPTGMDNVAPFGVAVDAVGTVWATLQNANKLVRISSSGEVTSFTVPTRRSGLTDVAVDSIGTVWFLEIVANKIGRFADGRFQEFPVPTPNAALTGLAVAPDGAVWFTELRGHKLGRLRNGVVTEFALPRPDARPFGIAVDAANNVWYTDLSGWLGRLAAERAKGR
jgi:virginiamycin B lyase